MDSSLYSALFGALSNEHKLNLVANNLANVQTVGYKQDKVTFEDTFLHFAHDYILDSKPFLRGEPLWPDPDVKAKPRLAKQITDYSQGGLRLTGNPLDLAIQGEGFFRVQDPNTGEVYLTRSGNFLLDAEGQIIDGNGNLLLAGGGPITLPPSAVVTIDNAGNVRVGEEELGTLDLVTVGDPQALRRLGGNLYASPGGEAGAEEELQPGVAVEDAAGEAQTIRATINQGYLESSNVEVVTEMVRMIEINRSFEAYNKVMQTSDTVDRRVIAVASKI